MLAALRNLMTDETGVTAIEYGLILSLIALAVVGVLTNVGSNLSTVFTTVATNL